MKNLPKKWPLFDPSGKQYLRHHYETAFKPARLANAAPQTSLQYCINLRRFDAFLKRPAKLTDLNDETVGQLISWLRRKHNLSPASAEKFQDNICSLWRFLFARGVVKVAPTIKKKRAPIRTPIAWTAEQLRRLWECLERLPGEIEGVPVNLWMMALHATIWDCGERIGATLQTRWSDIDLQRGWIIIRAERRKGSFCDKTSKLHPETVALLLKIVAPRRDLVWPWPHDKTYLYTIYKQILRGAGLPSDRYHGFHCLRKSCGSWVKHFGGNASDVLGHADPRTTSQVYIDPTIAVAPHAMDFLPRIYNVDGKGESNNGAA